MSIHALLKVLVICIPHEGPLSMCRGVIIFSIDSDRQYLVLVLSRRPTRTRTQELPNITQTGGALVKSDFIS